MRTQSNDRNSMVFAYVRVSTKEQKVDSQLSDISKLYPDAEITTEKVSGTVPAIERAGLSVLLGKLRKGDTLVVWWVDRLGRDYRDAESTIRELLDRGVWIKTINQGLTFSYSIKDDDMQNMVTDIQITMLTAMAAAERKNRLASAEAGRQALKANPAKWAEKFQGRKANTKQHQRIIELLLEGKSIRGVAQELGCNASTVQRVKKKAVEAGTVF
ncbi:recombinase family protein [Vibrio parahaemolyticus]|uniref:recombinase family protein n=1 Tax=Vibrio parahaemolyticus TaxID=670 RepID=UPI001EEC5B75|nr:recombinase family protein [Vibrio parahaemolyticus]MCG6432585.1 recombinase family protein [Vibrio parahaemolyticus]